MTRVTDGVGLRHKRVIDMLLFIKAQDGANRRVLFRVVKKKVKFEAGH